MIKGINIGAIASSHVAGCVEEFMKYPGDATISKIANALGGVTAFCKLPIPAWKEDFNEEGTGYIGGVQPRDLSAPIMRGVDPWGRPFVSILTEAERTIDGESARYIAVETLFQRYPDSLEPWTSGSHYDVMPLVRSVVNDKALNQLRELASGKSLVWNWENEKIIKKLDSL